MLTLTIGWLILRVLQVSLFGWGDPNDLVPYTKYAAAWSAGGAPYFDFHPEYPPLALLLFLFPYWAVGGGAHYGAAIGVEMALFDLALLLTVAVWQMKLTNGTNAASHKMAAGDDHSPARQFWGTMLPYLVATTLLQPVLYARFDVAVAFFTLLALYFVYSGSFVLSGVVFAVAVCTKVWPAILGPLLLLVAFRRGAWPALLRTTLGGAACTALCFLPFVPSAGRGVFGFLTYHGARGIQIESLWSSVIMVMHHAGLTSAEKVLEYGAWHLNASVAPLFVRLSMPALAAAVFLPQLLSRRLMGTPEDARGALGLRIAAAAIGGFLVAGKVFSPQYLLWLLPFLLLGHQSVVVRWGFVLACAITCVLFAKPGAYGALMNLDYRAVLILLARNGLVLMFFGYALWNLSTQPRSARPYTALSPAPKDANSSAQPY